VKLHAAIAAELRPYLAELVGRLERVTELEAVYLLGSGALGTWEPGSSDVDVVAVTARSLTPHERLAVAEAAESLPSPARKLELVVYPRGGEDWEVNLNTGEHVSFDATEEPPFWFVLDRAMAEEHAVALLGPPWGELFAPVARESVLEALAQALDWQEREEPTGRSSVLNSCRAWAWLETGEWLSKPAAAAWLRGRVRSQLEAAG
jgi:predicted nucleotidyltransferase